MLTFDESKESLPRGQGFLRSTKNTNLFQMSRCDGPLKLPACPIYRRVQHTAVLFFSLPLLLKLNIENDIKLHDAYDIFKKGKYVDHG